MYLETKEPAAAVPLLERALALDAHDYASRYQLAQAYKALGKPAEAEAQLRLLERTQKDILELSRLNQQATQSPWDASLRRRLADLCDKLGKPHEAEMWRQAAAACPAPPAAADPAEPRGGAPPPR
jgi:predicted Zn-dependent protease